MFERNNWYIYDMACQRHKDFLLNATNRRLARQALTRVEKHHCFYGRTLAWLGCRLVAWGWHLQERYGAAIAN